MIDINTIKEGFEEIEIEDKASVVKDCIENDIYLIEYNKKKQEIKETLEFIQNRFKIPHSQTKEFYQQLLKETKASLDYYNKQKPTWYVVELRDNYLEKYNKIKFILEKRDEKFLDVKKAKLYPIKDLLEIKNGFAICPFHDEETGSLKYYESENNTYCFGACKKHYDSIDIYMKLYNATLPEAITKLS